MDVCLLASSLLGPAQRLLCRTGLSTLCPEGAIGGGWGGVSSERHVLPAPVRAQLRAQGCKKHLQALAAGCLLDPGLTPHLGRPLSPPGALSSAAASSPSEKRCSGGQGASTASLSRVVCLLPAAQGGLRLLICIRRQRALEERTCRNSVLPPLQKYQNSHLSWVLSLALRQTHQICEHLFSRWNIL